MTAIPQNQKVSEQQTYVIDDDDPLSKVPQVTVAFWIVKIFATTLGETGGDALSMQLNLGYAVSTLIFLAFFCVTLAAQVRAQRYHPFVYWAVVVATTTETGKSHGHGMGLFHNKHETSTTSYSLQPNTSQTCNAAAATQSSAPVTPAAPVTPTPATAPVVQSSPATQSSPAAPVTQSAGSVLGVQTTLAVPRPARHGVLGAITNIGGSSLPFTGFPIWFAVVIALALIVGGLALRRRAGVSRT